MALSKHPKRLLVPWMPGCTKECNARTGRGVPAPATYGGFSCAGGFAGGKGLGKSPLVPPAGGETCGTFRDFLKSLKMDGWLPYRVFVCICVP